MGPNGQREIRNDPDYIRMAIDRSLKRLQTDYIDLWYWYVLRNEMFPSSSSSSSCCFVLISALEQPSAGRNCSCGDYRQYDGRIRQVYLTIHYSLVPR